MVGPADPNFYGREDNSHVKNAKHRWGFALYLARRNSDGSIELNREGNAAQPNLEYEKETFGSVGYYIDLATLYAFGGWSEYTPPPEVYMGWTSHQNGAYENQAVNPEGSDFHELGLFAIEAGRLPYRNEVAAHPLPTQEVTVDGVPTTLPILPPPIRNSAGDWSGRNARGMLVDNGWAKTWDDHSEPLIELARVLIQNPWPSAAQRAYPGGYYNTPPESLNLAVHVGIGETDLAPRSRVESSLSSGEWSRIIIRVPPNRTNHISGVFAPNPWGQHSRLPQQIAVGMIHMLKTKIEEEFSRVEYRGLQKIRGGTLYCAVGFMVHSGNKNWPNDVPPRVLGTTNLEVAQRLQLPSALTYRPCHLPGDLLNPTAHPRTQFLRQMVLRDLLGAWEFSAFLVELMNELLGQGFDGVGGSRYNRARGAGRALEKLEVARKLAEINRMALIRGCMRLGGELVGSWLGPTPGINDELAQLPGGRRASAGWPYYRHQDRYSSHAPAPTLPTDPLRLGRLEWFALALKITEGQGSVERVGNAARRRLYELIFMLQHDHTFPGIRLHHLSFDEFLLVARRESEDFDTFVMSEATDFDLDLVTPQIPADTRVEP